MRNLKLSELNFSELLRYGGQPAPRHRYPVALVCEGYCVDCERRQLAGGSGHDLDQMSHGCDTQDYEAILGPLLHRGAAIDAPIMFLMERPGGDKGNGLWFRSGES